ncbi:hypothetical protein LCGC14_2086830 [marine sediment metagenome]|uniref:Uncharacterized protein n=1 Tax=marine sediment metagenome TaxID=412755 RepID=A0A0F9GSA8_9ZZZZ
MSQLLRFYKLGYSNDQILEKFGPAYHLEDLESFTDTIWHKTPDEARIFFYTGFLG